jgi:transcriptional regulator with XRE-family HTH domain
MARRKSLSKELRLARESRGLSVAEVASRVGVSSVSIYFWEAGRVRPRLENLKALCKVLRLPVRHTMEATGV